jgi:hypothetical protein
MTYNERTQPSGTATSANSATSHAEATTKSFGRFQIPVHWKVNETLNPLESERNFAIHWKVNETLPESQTKYAIIGNPFPKPER